MTAQIARISEDRCTAEDHRLAMQTELDELRKSKTSLHSDLEELRKTADAGSQADQRIKQLEVELADVRAKSAAYLKKAAEGRKQLEATLESCKAKHAQEISALEERLATQIGKIAADGDQAYEQLKCAQAQVDELKRTEAETQDALTTARSAMRAKEERIVELMSESEGLKAALAARECEVAESRRQLEEQLDAAKAQGERAIAALQDDHSGEFRVAAQLGDRHQPGLAQRADVDVDPARRLGARRGAGVLASESLPRRRLPAGAVRPRLTRPRGPGPPFRVGEGRAPRSATRRAGRACVRAACTHRGVSSAQSLLVSVPSRGPGGARARARWLRRPGLKAWATSEGRARTTG